MSVGVSHTFGGNVVIVDMGSGLRFDLSPFQAIAAAIECDEAVEDGASHGLVLIQALEDRTMRFAGAAEDVRKMASDLREHAAKAMSQEDDGGRCE